MNIPYEKFEKVVNMFTTEEQTALLKRVLDLWEKKEPTSNIKSFICEVLSGVLILNHPLLNLKDSFKFLYLDIKELHKRECSTLVGDLFFRVLNYVLVSEIKINDIFIHSVKFKQYKNEDLSIHKYLEVDINVEESGSIKYVKLEFYYDFNLFDIENIQYSIKSSELRKVFNSRSFKNFYKKIQGAKTLIFKQIEDITKIFIEGVDEKIWDTAIAEEPSLNYPTLEDKLFMINVIRL